MKLFGRKNKLTEYEWRKADQNDIETVKSFRNAMKNADIALIKKMLKNNRELVRLTTVFGTFLHDAAKMGNLELVKVLIEYGADINKNETLHQCRPLASAAEKGNLNIVKYLYDNGAEYDLSEFLRNPLIKAIDGGNLEVVKFLVESDLDISKEYETQAFGKTTAYSYAKSYRKTDIHEYLRSVLLERGFPLEEEVNDKDIWHEFELEVTKMDEVQFNKLKEELHQSLPSLVAKEVRSATKRLFDGFDKDNIWGFALCTTDDVSSVTSVGSTKKWIEEKRNENPDVGVSPSEWSMETMRDDYEELNEKLRKLSIMNSCNDMTWLDEVERVFLGLVDGLKLIRDEGYFSTDTMLFVHGLDPNDNIARLSEESQRILN